MCCAIPQCCPEIVCSIGLKVIKQSAAASTFYIQLSVDFQLQSLSLCQSLDLIGLVCENLSRCELAVYKALKFPAAADNPLAFWKGKFRDFPILSFTARRILCISASSAQSERDFSSVGRTVTDMRSRLSADKIEAIELVRWGKRAGLADD